MKSELAFKKTQLLDPSKFASVPETKISENDLAEKRKKNFPLKRSDFNVTGSSTACTPTGANVTKRGKTKVSVKENLIFVYSNLSSSLDLDHWDNVLEDYLGTGSLW